MSILTDQEITRIIKGIQVEGVRSARRTADPETDFMLDFIDIDKFLEVLYSLLDSNNYIKKEDDENNPDKFVFTQEYPDILVNEKQVISAEIERRTLANLSANAEPFSGTSVYRPIYLGQAKDPIDGGINLNLQTMYDNGLRFTCWASKMMTARRLASLFESIMQKYYYVLRKYVPVFIYIGRGNTTITDKYGDSRYFGIPLNFFVRTNERFILKESELRTIKIETNVDSTLEQ
ncbi:MAG: hypothetical protein DRQ78_00065 [Epsilonproteobacteria bacterium]|nr:MAG: hypothetical protein DRQ78_00065 [Campylobacterota bacterium]